MNQSLFVVTAEELKAQEWELLAKLLNLMDIGEGFFRGQCPFCGIKEIYAININKNYAKCLSCDIRHDAVIKFLSSLIVFRNSREVEVSFS